MTAPVTHNERGSGSDTKKGISLATDIETTLPGRNYTSKTLEGELAVIRSDLLASDPVRERTTGGSGSHEGRSGEGVVGTTPSGWRREAATDPELSG